MKSYLKLVFLLISLILCSVVLANEAKNEDELNHKFYMIDVDHKDVPDLTLADIITRSSWNGLDIFNFDLLDVHYPVEDQYYRNTTDKQLVLKPYYPILPDDRQPYRLMFELESKEAADFMLPFLKNHQEQLVIFSIAGNFGLGPYTKIKSRDLYIWDETTNMAIRLTDIIENHL